MQGQGGVGERILVLAVDFDDDLSRAGIKTPVYGYKQVLDTALHFALYDPEDSDLNVLFALLKVVDELSSKGYEAIPAIVAGSEYGGVTASLAVRKQVEELVREVRPNGVIVVSDGSEDELVVPVISSIVNIYGVKRVIVKQHRGVEETYLLLVRYIRKALTEPRFSRLFLGFPGAILIVISALALTGMLKEAFLIGLLLLGIAMVLVGFGLEDKIISAILETPVSMVSYATAGLTISFALALFIEQLYNARPITPRTLATSLDAFTGMLGFALGVMIFGHILSKFISGTIRPGREALYVVVIAVMLILLSKIGEALRLMGSFSLGELVSALLQINFTLYTLLGIVVIGIVWKLGSIIDGVLGSRESKSTFQTSSLSSEKSK